MVHVVAKTVATLPKDPEIFFSGLLIFLAPGGQFPWAARDCASESVT